MQDSPVLRRMLFARLAVALLVVACGSPSPSPSQAPAPVTPSPTPPTASSPTTTPTSTQSPSLASPTATPGAEGADDGGPTQDLLILHGLRAILPGGTTVDLLPGLTDLASSSLGAPVDISSRATFREASALGSGMSDRAGNARSGVAVTGGLIEAEDSQMVAFFATPQPGGHWPGTDDLITFTLPQADGLVAGVPLVADYEFVQVLPGPLSAGIPDASSTIDDPAALLAARLRAGSYQFPAVGNQNDPEDVVFTGQIGRVLSGTAQVNPAVAAGPALGSGHVIALGAPRDTLVAQDDGGSSGGIPPKAKPFFDGMKGGYAKCLGRLFLPGKSSLKCVKDVLDGERKGAKGSNDLLNKNFPGEGGPGGGSPGGGSPGGCTGCGAAHNDPHIATFDRVRYDLQLVGEFLAARRPDEEVQIRTAPVPGSRIVAFVVDVAIRAEGHIVEVGVGRDQPILVDGQEVPASSPGSAPFTVDQLEVRWATSGVDVFDDGAPLLHVIRGSDHLNVFVVGGKRDGRWVGLLGNGDGRAAGDLVARDGQVVERTDAQFYERFADTWRISQAESLFSYGPGETTETYTDLSFPDGRASLDSLPADDRAQAEALCRAGGIDDPVLLDECTLDYALTKDTSMIEGAQDAQAAARADSTGDPSKLDGGLLAQGTSVVLKAEHLAEIRGGEVATGDGLALVRTTTERVTTLHAIDLETGEDRWDVPDVDPNCRPVVVPGLGVAAQLHRGSPSAGNEAPIVLLSLDDGSEVARSPGDTDACNGSLSAAGSVILRPVRGALYAYDAAKGMSELWSWDPDEILWGSVPIVDGYAIVFARQLPDTLRARSIEVQTGQLVDELPVAGGAQRYLNVIGNQRVALAADNGGGKQRATTVVEVSGGQLSQLWTRDFADESDLRQPVQLTSIDGLIAGWTVSSAGPGLVGFDATSGHVAWTQRATSFDNSRGMVETIAGSVVAITPFGGAWIELVDATGQSVAQLDAPMDGYVQPGQLTALADGRYIATGEIADGGGVYVLIRSLDPVL